MQVAHSDSMACAKGVASVTVISTAHHVPAGWDISGNVSEEVNKAVQAILDPTTPALVKMWLKHGGYAGMTLAEFLAGMGA